MYRVWWVLCTLSCAMRLVAGGPAAIAVFMDFQTAPSAEAIVQMEKEISTIMKPSGLQFEWRILKDRQDGESFRDLVVLSFKGHCQAAVPTYDELGPLSEKKALAYTRIANGHVLPYSDVECDAVRRYISGSVASAEPILRDAILGKALGRVVAHELYHILASSAVHGKAGVARSFHTRKDLTAAEFHFSEREADLLRVLNAGVQ
jgi:hypothetical protein